MDIVLILVGLITAIFNLDAGQFLDIVNFIYDLF